MTNSQVEYLSRELSKSYTKIAMKESTEDIIIDQLFSLCTESFVVPFLEYTDCIMEHLMYPQGFTVSPAELLKNNEKLTAKHIIPSSPLSLGHPILLQLIVLRNSLASVSNMKSKKDKCIIINSVSTCYNIICHIFDFLERDQVVVSRKEIDNHLLKHFGQHMATLEGMFLLLCSILNFLNQIQQPTSSLSINPTYLSQIDKLITLSKDFCFHLLKNSRALKDYSILKDTRPYDADFLENLQADSEFKTFLQSRKALLQLTNRRVI